jgi:hypothetical protein
MSLHGFEQDFTKDLESFVKKETEWIFPLTTWAPRKVAAPERHRMLGFLAGVSVQTQLHLLDTQNPAFEMMESMLRLYMNPVEYSLLGVQKEFEIDLEKEQVWLFAMRWLTHYYECLTEPLVIRTDFYKQSHTKFLSLMRSMLQYSPGRRVSFADALTSWQPKTEESPGLDSQQTQTHVAEPARKEVPEVPAVVPPGELRSPGGIARSELRSERVHPSKNEGPPVAERPDERHSPHPVVSSDRSSVPSSTAARLRLVLKRSADYAERNKTRRNLRNSNRSPANGSSAKQT